jgi:hypothetical protein
MELNCPRCKQIDKVEKVSALIGRASGTSSYGSAEASIASKLRKPGRPSETGLMFLFFGALLGLYGAVMLAIVGKQAIDAAVFNASALIGPVASLLGGAGLWLVGRKSSKDFQAHELPAWERKKAWWQDLYYCGRCDGVFVVGDDAIVPTEEARKRLR